MSRCFPFPPPGYMRNGACSKDLIESIKLQKEREEAKAERKKEKRKSKEKRKDRKDRKEREGKATHAREGKGKESKINNVESYHLEKIKTEPGIGCLRNGDDDENEQLERSGITEEHDRPFSSNEPCCLSDSTQSSNKRKRGSLPSSNDHGTTIRIRLPLRKHREPEESQSEYQSGSNGNLGTTNSFTKEIRQQYQCRGNSYSEHNKEYQDLVQDSAGVDPSTNSIDNESQRMASLYNSLFQNWISRPLQCEGFKLDDQDWLFSSVRQEQTPAPKKVKSVVDPIGCSSPTLWPRARYLPEADIYGLPYAVPF